MAESPQPVLVYDRIDANRRNTRFLMAAFVALLLPLAGGVAQYLTPGSIFTGTMGLEGLQPTTSEFLAELMVAVIVLLVIASAAVCAAQFGSSHAGYTVPGKRQPNLVRDGIRESRSRTVLHSALRTTGRLVSHSGAASTRCRANVSRT